MKPSVREYYVTIGIKTYVNSKQINRIQNISGMYHPSVIASNVDVQNLPVIK